jgi:altronate dehydratase
MNLANTLAWAKSVGSKIEKFGPYTITESMYQLAEKQKKKLELGHIKYKANDRGLRPDIASNCIHAISDIVCRQENEILITGTNRGFDATKILVEYLKKKKYIIGDANIDHATSSAIGVNF